MNLPAAVDLALDRSIVLGYGSVGLAVRRKLPTWPNDPPRIDGRVVLITGAASGIGLASAIGFARLGATVLAHGRDQARAQDARAGILRAVPKAEARAVACDVSSLDEIAGLAKQLSETEPRLDVLVNNAGVMPEQRERSADGHERMFATHVLAPFAFTALLRDLLVATAPARVINVSSGGMYGQRMPRADLESAHDSYGPKKIYARTKREEVAITEAWAKQLDGTGVVVHSMHPGWVDTKGVRESLPAFRAVTRPILRTLEQGADTIVWLGASPDALRSTGRFWHDRRPRPVAYPLGAPAPTAEDRRQLWEYCEAAMADALAGGPDRPLMGDPLA